jgi:hypothetical protein
MCLSYLLPTWTYHKIEVNQIFLVSRTSMLELLVEKQISEIMMINFQF